jgi:ribosome-dependent ATPase
MQRTGHASLEAAFVALLPEAKRRGHQPVVITALASRRAAEIAIEAQGLTMRFGDFVAVDHVSFRIQRGEIFGFLGSNGCGKSTTMKMLTGLLPASDGRPGCLASRWTPKTWPRAAAWATCRRRSRCTASCRCEQNLVLHARLFHVPEAEVPAARADHAGAL